MARIEEIEVKTGDYAISVVSNNYARLYDFSSNPYAPTA